MLAVGHGRMLHQPAAAMRAAVADAQQRLQPAGGSDEPRQGLDSGALLDAATQIVDSDGFEALTLAALAKRLDVRSPSLYNHISGLPGLRQELALMSVQQLGLALTEAAADRNGDEAIQAIAAAYIGFVRQHPGLYEASYHAPDLNEPQLAACKTALLDMLLHTLQPYPSPKRKHCMLFGGCVASAMVLPQLRHKAASAWISVQTIACV